MVMTLAAARRLNPHAHVEQDLMSPEFMPRSKRDALTRHSS